MHKVAGGGRGVWHGRIERNLFCIVPDTPRDVLSRSKMQTSRQASVSSQHGIRQLQGVYVSHDTTMGGQMGGLGPAPITATL